MIPYKQIGENLSITEFNGIVSLLRNNVNFEEDIHIKNSEVTGEFGKYEFNFNEATIVDNGILITNETLSTIGTVKLLNPLFPNSNYFIDLKVYSTEQIHIGDFGDNDEGIITTEITVPLQTGVEVNIPFETLNMNNIIGFDAKIRINHKDLVIRGTDRINLSGLNKTLTYVSIPLSATYKDSEGNVIPGKYIKFYDGQSLIDTIITNEGGVATLNHSFDTVGTHTFRGVCEAISSDTYDITVVDTGDLICQAKNLFKTGSATPFEFSEDYLSLNYGDNTGELYSTGTINHTFDDSNNHTVNILGTITKLENNCFKQNTGLISAIIPNSVTNIGNSCFAECSNLTSVTIPNTVTSIGDACFNFCTGLTSVTIPDSVTNIGGGCFNNCTALTSVNLSSNITSLGGSFFNNCTNLSNLTIPASVTSIGSYCFQDCTSLTSINIPNSVTSIGNNAFYRCTGLTNVTLSNTLQTIGIECFRGCSNVGAIVIPGTLSTVSERCFYQSGVTSVVIEEGVTTLGWYCFRECSRLRNVTIPASVTSIGANAFYGDSIDEYNLNWDSASTIIEYNSSKMPYVSNTVFNIPVGTTALYVAKGYPSSKLVEPVVYTDFTFTERNGKSILSKADGDIAYLDAQLTDSGGNPVAVSGVGIDFYQDNTLLDTVQTDSTGKATYSYTSQGVGDTVFSAGLTISGSYVSKTYAIEDCGLYRTPEIYKSGNDMQYPLFNDYSLVNTGDWEVSCDLKTTKSFIALTSCSNESMSTNNCTVYTGIGANSSGAKLCALGFNPTITDGILWNTSGPFGSDYVPVKITKVGNKYTFYYNGSELANTTSSDFSAQTPLYLVTRHNSGGNCYVKNIKIKPL